MTPCHEKTNFIIFTSLKIIYISLTVSFVFAKYPHNLFGLYFLFFYAMNSSVRQSLRCRAIYASDLLILRKKSLAAPIHQTCLLFLSTLKRPADQLLHVSTSVENLKFKCETTAMSTVMRKNITGVYLATRWAVPNVIYQQLNASALTPYPTLPIMTLNLSPGKASYSSWDSMHQSTEVINKTNRDISFSIKQRDEEPFVCKIVKAGDEEIIEKELFQNRLRVPTTVIISAGSEKGAILTHDFINYKKLVFNIDANGKLVGQTTSYKDVCADLHIRKIC